MPRHDVPLECKVYVGDLDKEATEKDLERAFSYYGPLKAVWVARNPPGFAFVEFEDARDAEDAVRAMDGETMCGSKMRVEFSSGKVRPKPWLNSRRPPQRGGGGGGGGGGGRGFDPDDRCYNCGERGHYAYDCRRGGSRRSRSRSRGRRRSHSRDRHSRDRQSRDRHSRDKSRSRDRYGRSSRKSRTPRRSRSYSRSRSRD